MAVNIDVLKVFIGSLGDAVQAGVVMIGRKLGLYRAHPKAHLNSTELVRTVRASHGWRGNTADPRLREIIQRAGGRDTSPLC